MLIVHRAERADALVAALGGVLARPGGDPFRPETVAVPSRGIERWLAQQLSHSLGADGHRDGVCANVAFPNSTQVLDDAVADAHAGYADAVRAWAPERVVWPLMQVVDECATEPWCRLLATHLGVGSDDRGRRFAVAGKLARLFHRYGTARPQLIREWRAGHDGLPADLGWQAELWRRLRARLDVPAPAELLEDACTAIGAGPDFSIFGATRISPARVTVLAALSRTRDIHLWLHHPSPALWRAVGAAGERPGPRRTQRPVVAHPLLSSMSRDVRELQQLLSEVDHRTEHHPIPARPPTVLGRLQQALADDVTAIDSVAADSSVQVHAAHGPARQVEVIREVILGLLAADPTLEPRDIVIMCPDVETFAPLVAASFGMADEPGAHPAARLRIRLADRSLRQTNPLLGLLSQLLEIANGRVSATQVLDLAGAAATRRRFGFDDDDVERLREWTVAAGARWGLDPQHRDQWGLGRIGQGTWRAALDRLLLGVAMEDELAWVGQTLPLDDVDSSDIELAGRFAELLDRLDAIVRALAGDHTVPEWMRLLEDAVRDLGEAEQPWQQLQVRLELEEVADSAADSDVRLGLVDVTGLLRAQLAGRPTRASFRTGTLTVCTLVPMRSVPHRVVCLLGMDDGVFPRQSIADGDDVLAREPRSGERDVRSEDRQLFLDAICAAEHNLVIAYSGADPRSGAAVPPCVPLGELLDALDAFVVGGRAAVLTHHPLQPFDARNFAAPRPFSFDPSGLAAARSATGPRVPVPPLVREPLAPHVEPVVGLDDLVQYLQHPARGFLRQRLGVAMSRDEEEPADALDVELDGLQNWGVGDRVLRRCIAGADRATAAQLERMRGELPPGPLGTATLQRIGRRVDALLAASAADREQPATSLDVAVALPDGRTLAGTVTGVRGSCLLTVTYSRLAAKHRLAAWVRYLATVAMTDDPDWRATTVGRHGDGARTATLHGVAPPLAVRVLDHLVRIRDAGLREPLPLALETSMQYARRRANVSVADALAGARQAWEADKFTPERDEPEHVLAFGAHAPLEVLTREPAPADEQFPDEHSRFGTLARLVWAPLLTVETEQW